MRRRTDLYHGRDNGWLQDRDGSSTQITLAADCTLVFAPHAQSWGQLVFTRPTGTGSNLRGLHSVVCWPPPIQYGSHFIDWRDTWGPFFNWGGAPSQQKSHESNDQYLRSHPARGQGAGGGGHMFGIWTYGCPLFTSQTQLVSFWEVG